MAACLLPPVPEALRPADDTAAEEVIRLQKSLAGLRKNNRGLLAYGEREQWRLDPVSAHGALSCLKRKSLVRRFVSINLFFVLNFHLPTRVFVTVFH